MVVSFPAAQKIPLSDNYFARFGKIVRKFLLYIEPLTACRHLVTKPFLRPLFFFLRATLFKTTHAPHS